MSTLGVGMLKQSEQSISTSITGKTNVSLTKFAPHLSHCQQGISSPGGMVNGGLRIHRSMRGGQGRSSTRCRPATNVLGVEVPGDREDWVGKEG